ncbi:Multifunctional CCA protein [Buchnera aphidicola (Eriosoma lanigerum)]|uniref:tRNA CCA-pyrophosphorylase n=1 Tax=Buchnera aphidicola TaxID=9 RepID=UPI003464D183
MKIYLVGGAVRDSLLNLPIKDKDWVVVGATIEMLLKNNFQQVGKGFPVFLHPVSHEEYALARTEYKLGHGYYGFKTNFSPEVTLEDDLMRRDLTINAIAQTNSGKLIDPYCGQVDLKNRILRHVSPSFVDDPLRVLRVARFAATFSYLGFSIATETLLIMKSIVKSKELLYLKSERIWKETEKAFVSNHPHVYFQILHACNALILLFPEINRLFNIDSTFYYFYNMWNKNIHLLKYLAYVSKKTKEIDVRLACLFQLLKIKSNFITNVNIDQEKQDYYCYLFLQNFFVRFNIPIYIRDLSILIIKYHNFINNIFYAKSYDIVIFLGKIDAWRKPKRIKKIELLSNLYYKLFQFQYNKSVLPGKFLSIAYSITSTVTAKFILHLGFKGIEISKELVRLRSMRLDMYRKNIVYYR